MGKFITGVIVGVILVPVAVYFYFTTGHAPTSVFASPFPMEKKVAMRALHARADREAPKNPPFQPSEADYIAGAQTYRNQCAVCHGLPGQPKTAIAKGEYPVPPQLWAGDGVTDDPAGETYWKVMNGIRLTGMPGFKNSLSDHAMWQLSFLLATDAEKLPASANDLLKRPLVVENPSGQVQQPTP